MSQFDEKHSSTDPRCPTNVNQDKHKEIYTLYFKLLNDRNREYLESKRKMTNCAQEKSNRINKINDDFLLEIRVQKVME